MRTLLLLLGLSLAGNAGVLKPDVDFSHYDTPLYEQIVNRIKTHVSERLGEGKNTRDRYFIIPFAYENRENDPEFSHSFLSVIRVFADNKQPRFTGGLRTGKVRNREFEAFTISWLPNDFPEHPDLCVFNGFASRAIATNNTCPVSPGKSFDLKTTIKLASNVKNAVAMWGPYEIKKEAFELGVNRKRLLDTGKIKYRADDRLYRKEKIAINCFHAIAGLDELYPNGGLFGTGFKMWGLNGTARVLIEYTQKASNKGMLLEPVNVKKDRFGFVYAPARGAHGIYNPVQNASAYHR
jgi:hypothetical protein